MHVSELVAAAVLDHIPELQDVQALDPVTAHEPAMQVVHEVLLDAPTFGEAAPAAQFKHEAETEAPIEEEYVPTMQLMQEAELVANTVVEYVPATQDVHKLAPDADHAPVGHAKQTVAWEAPRLVDAIPAEQSRHMADAEAPTEVE